MLKKIILTVGVLSLFCANVYAERDSVQNPFGTGISQSSDHVVTKEKKTTQTVSKKSTSNRKSKTNESCGNFPKTCSQMTSCAQAKAALKCGHTRLDRDHDGIPCETICGG